MSGNIEINLVILCICGIIRRPSTAHVQAEKLRCSKLSVFGLCVIFVVVAVIVVRMDRDAIRNVFMFFDSVGFGWRRRLESKSTLLHSHEWFRYFPFHSLRTTYRTFVAFSILVICIS